MTNPIACNKGALVHRKRRMSVPPLAHLSNTYRVLLNKLLGLLLLFCNDPNSPRTHQIDAVKGRNGGGVGVGGGGGGDHGV